MLDVCFCFIADLLGTVVCACVLHNTCTSVLTIVI